MGKNNAENGLPKLTLKDYGIETPEDVNRQAGFINAPVAEPPQFLVDGLALVARAVTTANDVADRVLELPGVVGRTVFDSSMTAGRVGIDTVKKIGEKLPVTLKNDTRGIYIDIFPQK